MGTRRRGLAWPAFLDGFVGHAHAEHREHLMPAIGSRVGDVGIEDFVDA